MPEREADGFLARSRTVSIPAWFAVLTGCLPEVVVRYRRPTSHEMWLVLGSQAERFKEYDALGIREQLNDRGFYCVDYLRSIIPWTDGLGPTIGPYLSADPPDRRARDKSAGSAREWREKRQGNKQEHGSSAIADEVVRLLKMADDNLKHREGVA
jgi:hypothetical protein